jgi:anti-anti-sigma regulatory factor
MHPDAVHPPILDLTAAADLKRDLLAIAASGPGGTIDASQVRRITTPCLQVLVAARRSGDGGPAFRLVNPSTAFLAALSTLALGPALGQPDASDV